MKQASLRLYFRACRVPAAALLLCALIFASVFALYGLPLGAVLYPSLLCVLGGAVFLALRMRRVLARCAHLARLNADALHELPAPGGPLEEQYQALLRRIAREHANAREQLQESHALAVDYYSLWAHQIKTPIASMRLNLQNESSALTRQLSGDVLRVEQYVDMALMFFKLDQSATDYVLRSCDVDALIRQALRRLSSLFIRKKLRLVYDSKPVRVVTDEKWLGFVIEQVLTNALKYTDDGEIAITWEEPSVLCIRDTGVGIAPEDLPRIFEKGFTGIAGRRDQRASGIGLYLCRRLCAKLGHAITAQSALGEGTAIRIDLSQKCVAEPLLTKA